MMVVPVTGSMLLHVALPPSRRAEHIMAMHALDRPSPSDTRRPWLASEVRALIAAAPLPTPRYELIDGELLVTPSPAWSHQQAVVLLVVRLYAYLRVHRVARVGTSPSDIELEPETVTQPDVFAVPLDEVRRVEVEGFPIRSLLLAVEVLSPSSGQHDRERKRPIYQRHVPEYWIVDPDARMIERWRPRDDRPEILVDTLEWFPSGADEPLRISLPEYFAEVFGEV